MQYIINKFSNMIKFKVNANGYCKEQLVDNTSKSKTSNKKLIGTIVLAVFTLLFAVASMYFFVQYQKIKKDPSIVTKQESEVLLAQIGKLIEIPKDETPTIATIQDKEKLKDQPFFANAQNGDKIVIYTKAKKAIVFRPKDNKIINVGPIAIDQQATVSVALVNAGGDVASIEKQITDKLGESVTIVSKTDANTKNTKQLTVVDVSGNNAEGAKKVAEAIGAEVGELPAGEDKPANASVVVFVK